MVRTHQVEVLVQAALNGLAEASDGTTSAEMVSACLTLASRTISAVMELHPEYAPTFQAAVGALMLTCADSRTTH